MSEPAHFASEASPSASIRVLNGADAAAMAGIEAVCPDAAQWGGEAYARLDHGEFIGFGAYREGKFLAFIVARLAADEFEILNLAVVPESRRRGLASRLLSAALAWGTDRRASRAFLEVRESNVTARAFYQSHGFNETGRRKSYYSHPYEDALILTHSLG